MTSDLEPTALIKKQAARLFDKPGEQSVFLDALCSARSLAPAIVWTADRPEHFPFRLLPPLPWQPSFVDRLEGGQEPTKHPLHQGGSFYSLDFSSVFDAAGIVALSSNALDVVFDLCSAPGGKAVLAWRALKPKELVCNEVIGKRIGAVISNLSRLGIEPVSVMSADVSRIAKVYGGTGNLVIVDAPCSGQSLRAKGGFPPGAFHPATVNMNSNRQKRIIGNAASIVSPDGYLSYMTCTFAREENEDVCRWFLKKFPRFEPIIINSMEEFRSHYAYFPCYRLFPQHGIGAGGFFCIFKNSAEGAAQDLVLAPEHVRWRTGKRA